MGLSSIIDLQRCPLGDEHFIRRCKTELNGDGVLIMSGFLCSDALAAVKREAVDSKHSAYFCAQTHTVYLSAPDPQYPEHHSRNRQIVSTKGCVPDDLIPQTSLLRTIYNSATVRKFLCKVLEERALYPYADALSSINVHYYEAGQELGWHFDNSSFAITLTVQAPDAGGELEYVRQLRTTAAGGANYDGVRQALDGNIIPGRLTFSDGMLVVFRGKETLHRVTPVRGGKDRIQVVFAYNNEPFKPLAAEARQTFYGRLQ